MEQERIRELLDKYYEGKTSEEEEAQLKSYLSDPSSQGTESAYLTDMSPEVPEPSEDFYGRLEAVTRGEEEIMTGMTPPTGVPPSIDKSLRFIAESRDGGPSQTRMTARRGIIRFALSIAAAAAIITGVYMIFDYTGRMEMQDTYKDPDIAMAEVRSILMTVSEKMTTGTESLGAINSMNIAPGTLDELGKINSMVGENLSKLRYLDRLAGSQKNTDNN